MKIYIVCHQHEPDCPTEIGPASRHREVAVKALHKDFMGLIHPDAVDDFHGYETTMEGDFVVSFQDPEGSGPSGHIEELEVEDEQA